MSCEYSIVVPFYNESENLPALIAEIDAALSRLGKTAEIILVNDASTDCFDRPVSSPGFPIRWIDLTRQSGQSAALYFGFQAAVGERIAMLDADLQNDPADLSSLIAEMDKTGVDLVTGVRVNRQDTWFRRFSSRLANHVRATVLNDHTSDTGCSLKVMRRVFAQRLPGWNGMHRFIPALALAMGYRTGEVPVNHRSRHRGVSKVHGARRAVRATFDLLGMIWLSSRQFKGHRKDCP